MKRTKCGLDDIHDRLNGVDVGDDLPDAFHGIGAVPKQQDGGGLDEVGGTKRWLII